MLHFTESRQKILAVSNEWGFLPVKRERERRLMFETVNIKLALGHEKQIDP